MIYFIKPIGMDGPIKIGYTRTPAKRLMEMATWSPWPLELLGCVPGELSDESFVHRCFADLHSHKEWFRSSPFLRETIQRIVEAGSLDAVRGELQPVGKIPTHSRTRKPQFVAAGSPPGSNDSRRGFPQPALAGSYHEPQP